MAGKCDDKGVAVVILSALSVELRADRPHLMSAKTVRHRAGTRFMVGTVGEDRRRVAATVTGEGNHAAAIIAERAITLFRAPQVHFGGVAAGEVVLKSQPSSLSDHLRRHYGDAIAVEMESAGVAHASHLNRSAPSLTIRAISDAANDTKGATDAAGWQARAAANVAAFAVALIKNI